VNVSSTLSGSRPKEVVLEHNYREKPCLVYAVQWFKEGDYPEIKLLKGRKKQICRFCQQPLWLHGWYYNSNDGGELLCPGDWVVEEDGRYPMK
jgi:hypothetical protein